MLSQPRSLIDVNHVFMRLEWVSHYTDESLRLPWNKFVFFYSITVNHLRKIQFYYESSLVNCIDLTSLQCDVAIKQTFEK